MDNAVLLERVSSKEQARGDSINAQDRRLREFSQTRDYKIVDVYADEGKSASLKEDRIKLRITSDNLGIDFDLNQRPELKRLINDAKLGKFKVVLFYKWDRFSRSVIFAKICKMYFDSLGIKLIPSDDSEDPLTSSIMQVLSENEVNKLKERVRSTRLLRFERGDMISKAPIGYTYDKITKKMNVDNEKAKLVKKVFQMASEGYSYKQICAICSINPQTYYNILRNKIYKGILTFEGQERPTNFPPLISKEIWDKANLKKSTT